ncbi:hypothetical protein ACFLZG_08145 [Thermodesulfobacteriota bacterium]
MDLKYINPFIHATTYPIIAVPFITDNGEFMIEVCFEEGEGQ